MEIKKKIKEFYNNQAKNFSITRKKIWPEFKYIEKEIKKHLETKEKINILELWCGDWRLYRYLNKIFPNQINYIWVDLSDNLISIAKQETENGTFIVDDMLNFVKNYEIPENFDFVIAVASFQHIPNKQERLEILKNVYRLLKYNWELIMFNWSFSKWFIKKYFLQILKSIIKNILSLWTKNLNDILVPWKDKNKVYYRYYHIFFLWELINLFKQAWFVIKESWYINKKWLKDKSWLNSRNSYIIWEKKVLED